MNALAVLWIRARVRYKVEPASFLLSFILFSQQRLEKAKIPIAFGVNYFYRSLISISMWMFKDKIQLCSLFHWSVGKQTAPSICKYATKTIPVLRALYYTMCAVMHLPFTGLGLTGSYKPEASSGKGRKDTSTAWWYDYIWRHLEPNPEPLMPAV